VNVDQNFFDELKNGSEANVSNERACCPLHPCILTFKKMVARRTFQTKGHAAPFTPAF
jgi:hypothetical protein